VRGSILGDKVVPISEKFIKKFGHITEEYKFYNDEVILRYDVKAHKYFLVKDGELVVQDGVTNVVHIIDKSEVLMNWSDDGATRRQQDRTPDGMGPVRVNHSRSEEGER
jgi:hypothetical protein